MKVFRGLRGTPPSQFWIGPAPAAYMLALQTAQRNAYSVALDIAPVAGGGQIVDYVNPDGTLGQITAINSWPLVPVSADASFISPPQATWNAMLTGLGASAAAGQSTLFGSTTSNTGPTGTGTSTSPPPATCAGFTVGSTCIPTTYMIAGGVGILLLVVLMGRR